MNQEISLEKIAPSDFEEVTRVAHNNGGSKKFSPAYLTHQYLENPSHSYSLWKVVKDVSIEGFATTNNFKFSIEKKLQLVAMPQNVLTSQKLRGKGLFNRLYHCTEEENKQDYKIDHFLTFTNEKSTPIFLKKFGYKVGICPDIIFYLPLPQPFRKKNYQLVSSIEVLQLNEQLQMPYLDNAMIKDKSYYIWRYKNYSNSQLKILQVHQNNKIIGTVILKVEQKRGIRFLLLMDVLCINNLVIIDIIQCCRNYAWNNMFAGILLFKLNGISYPASRMKKVFKQRFNFLVKGATEEKTIHLAGLAFNLHLGDLDIF